VTLGGFAGFVFGSGKGVVVGARVLLDTSASVRTLKVIGTAWAAMALICKGKAVNTTR
jgi:hypothetical protein